MAPPASVRTSPRSRAWTASQVPSIRHNRDRVYTVRRGGKSCGGDRPDGFKTYPKKPHDGRRRRPDQKKSG
jgi:hypothetical protein